MGRSFTDLFIRRPVLASVVSLMILLVGLGAFTKLQIRQYPELESTSITITTTYPGANADLIKGFITTPIAQAVSSSEGIDTLVSNSQQNVSTITLNLRLNANADRAVADVLSKINQVKYQLPRESQDPVVVKKTGDSTALMYLSFNSKVLTPPQITDYLTRVVQPRLQTIDGVASADILGGQTFAMRIWLDPMKMAARGVTAGDVSAALARNNFTSAAGQVKGDFTQTSIDAQTSLDSAKAFAQLIVASRGDALIRIGDIATTELGPEAVDSSSVFDGEKAVFIGINATPTANPLEVITKVRKEFPSVQADLPAGMTAAIGYDATKFIRASISEVEKTLAEAALIVVAVIFLFLGNLRSTLIPIVTIPLSLVGVMIALLALGYSINLLTLLAMVLAIGLVVDDAIVVVENIYRHIEEGLTPYDASIKGAREITGPVISMTITLAAVYAPIGFVSGLTGALFREFAFALAGSVVVSGVIALTLSPMMCSKLLRPPPPEGTFSFARVLDRVFDWFRRIYSWMLVRSLNFRALTLLILVGVLALTAIMFQTTPRELAPEEDQGVIFALVKAPQYGNLDYIERSTAQLAQFSSELPEYDHLFAINGYQGVTSGFGGIILKNWGNRTRSQKDVLQAISPKFDQITGAKVIGFAPPALPGSTGGPPIQFVLRSIGDYKDIAATMAKIETAAQKSGLFIFSDSDLKFDTPQLEVKIDAAKANRLGLSMQEIGSSLATFLGGNYVNRFNLYGRSYEVIPQVPRDNRLVPDWLLRYQLRTAGGDLVPLSAVASVTPTVQPNSLPSFQQLNSATLQGVPFPGHTIGEALAFLQQQAKELMPEGFTLDYQGESRQFVQEGNTLLYTFVFALIVIYLVLAAQFESFRDPFIILIALPTSMFGALLPLNALGVMGLASLNIYSEIGLVTLIGLISKHGILMVEFANRLQEEGLSRRAAIEQAAAVRLRPILMTTAAMVVAMVPLMVAEGAGARSRFALGIVIAFGMSIGTMFTLFVTPAVYTLVARDRSRDRVASETRAPVRLATRAAAE
ncbi:putative transporter [Beijerinckiaceae bacterium RH AL1]|nr:putative transporter [Beijerinckiaceae bacterium RH CH11]VVB44382.1 putative transporter [Beijerinckiaceae bacterium RH AL8]VVC54287.1 putative transporter [Beijerinckiaceae bacterium RH AL1]